MDNDYAALTTLVHDILVKDNDPTKENLFNSTDLNRFLPLFKKDQASFKKWLEEVVDLISKNKELWRT